MLCQSAGAAPPPPELTEGCEIAVQAQQRFLTEIELLHTVDQSGKTNPHGDFYFAL